MADATVIQANHGIRQDVAAKNPILKAPISAGHFNIDAPENLLFLSNNYQLAGATGTIRHASNHAPVGDAQNAVLDDFGKTPTQYGKTYLQLMQADVANLSQAERALRNEIFGKAETLELRV